MSKIEVPDSVIATKHFDEKILNDTSVLIPFIIIKEGETLKLSYESHSCWSLAKNYEIIITKKNKRYLASLYDYAYSRNKEIVNNEIQDVNFYRYLIDLSKKCKLVYDNNDGNSFKRPKDGFRTGYQYLKINNGLKEIDMPLINDNNDNFDIIEPLINEILGKNKIWKS